MKIEKVETLPPRVKQERGAAVNASQRIKAMAVDTIGEHVHNLPLRKQPKKKAIETSEHKPPHTLQSGIIQTHEETSKGSA